MKKLLLSLSAIALLTIFTTSCGDDDEKPANPLIGTWALSKEVYSGCDDDADNSSVVSTCTESECITLTFDASGNAKTTAKSDDVQFSIDSKYTTSGSNVTITTAGDPETAEFKVSGNTLTLTYSTDEDGCESVTTFTKK